MSPEAFQAEVLAMYYRAVEDGDVCLARTCRSALRGAADCVAEIRTRMENQNAQATA